MNRSVVMIFAAALAGGCALQAQSNPLIAESKRAYTAIETNLTKAADEMSDANYSFKATPDVRTFGATIAHIADVQMRTCSAVKGEQKQADAAPTYFAYQLRRRTSMPVAARALANALVSDPL